MRGTSHHGPHQSSFRRMCTAAKATRPPLKECAMRPLLGQAFQHSNVMDASARRGINCPLSAQPFVSTFINQVLLSTTRRLIILLYAISQLLPTPAQDIGSLADHQPSFLRKLPTGQGRTSTTADIGHRLRDNNRGGTHTRAPSATSEKREGIIRPPLWPLRYHHQPSGASTSPAPQTQP